MNNMTLENDWVLKTGKIVSKICRVVLLSFAIIAGLIGILALVAGTAGAISPELVEGVTEEPWAVSEAFGLAGLMGLLAIGLWLSARFFALLSQIIQTVGDGDPFIEENADRLQSMAIINLMLSGLSLIAALGILAFTQVYDVIVEDLTMDVSLEGLFMALLLFILARVFRHGAAMRADLEGTV